MALVHHDLIEMQLKQIGKDNGNTYRLRPMKHSNLSDTSVAYTTNLVNIAIAGSGKW